MDFHETKPYRLSKPNCRPAPTMLYANAILLTQFHPPCPPGLSNQDRSIHLFRGKLGIVI